MKAFKSLLALCLFLGCGYAAASGNAIFIKIEGVAGESLDANHKGWSNVESFSYGIGRDSAEAGGGLRRGGQVEMGLKVVKPIDRATPYLSEAVAKGKVIPRVLMEVCSGGQGGGCRLTYELKNVRVASVTIKSENQSLPLETVSLVFDEIRLRYIEYSKTGAPAGSKEFNWTMH
jgi:type VI secretion system Hcp family effector